MRKRENKEEITKNRYLSQFIYLKINDLFFPKDEEEFPILDKNINESD